MSNSLSATVAAGAPLVAEEARANFPRYQTTPRERGEAASERIATSLNLEGITIVVGKINKSSRPHRARGPPMGRPNRQYEGSRCTAQQRIFPSRRQGKIIGALNLSESHQHGADRR